MKLTASVVLTTYNGEKHLRAQLDSLVIQTILPNELIVCDDLSTDTTLEILRQFSKIAPFPVYIFVNTKRLGYTKNFEKAVSLARSDVLFYCDQDDVWVPEKIQLIMEVFEAEPDVGQVLHICDFIDGSGKDVEKKQPMFGLKQLSVYEMPKEVKDNSTLIFIDTRPFGWYGCMYAFRRIWTEILIPFFPDAGHDTWSLHIIGALGETRFIDKKLIHRRIHSANTTAKHANGLIRLLKHIYVDTRHLILRQTRKSFKRAIIKRIIEQPNVRHPKILEKLKSNVSFFRRFTIMLKWPPMQ